MNYTSFNDQSLIEHFSGDEEILLDMISIFENGLQDLLGPIRQSILNQDADKLRLNAHTFKGVMGNFYAEEGKKLAYELELRGENSTFSDALDLLNELENQLLLFLFELKKLKDNLINKG